jgi:hypothetical protein
MVLKITTENSQCSEQKNASINRSQQDDLMMADAPSEALRRTCLNKECMSLLPCVLHHFFLKLEHEEVKAWLQKEESKAINTRIWGHATKFLAFAPVVAKLMTTVRKMGEVSSKLICCWAIKALENDCVSQDQQVAIFTNLVNFPDIDSITEKSDRINVRKQRPCCCTNHATCRMS